MTSTFTAATADKHVLYQQSVQDVEAEIDFVDARFTAITGRQAQYLREDFSGTAQTSCEWVKRRDTNVAVAVDLDNEVLEWGRNHNIPALSEDEQSRISLHCQDVRASGNDGQDVVLAMNFSYWLFEQRAQMLDYFKQVYADLVEDGVFFLDAYGGYEAPKELTEERECEGFTYIWDQARFNPINSRMHCYIHFTFPDGSRMDKAFSYTWRLWTLPEIKELLLEAGFAEVVIYWEGTDEESGEGDGIFEPATEGDADPGWICYISAQKKAV